MDRAQKAEAVESLRGIFAEAGGVVVARYAGLTVADMTALRAKLRDADASLKVVKNRLAKIALEDTEGEGGRDLFNGPSAIVFAKDPVAVSRVAVDYAKEKEEFILIGGMLGPQVLDEAGVKALATMPSLDELRAKLLGVMTAPLSQFVGILNKPSEQLVRTVAEPGRGLASVLGQRKAQLEAA